MSPVWTSQELRRAQEDWARTTVPSRVRIVRRIRDGLASEAKTLIDLFPSTLVRSRADTITCEILPLAEACRFLELEAERILEPRRVSTTARPFWLRRVEVELRREPLGLVLIIGASNYPLFLAGAQALQALIAGNAVLLKPGRGACRVLKRFAELAFLAGIPRQLITVLGEQVESATEAIDSGDLNKIVMTGSVESGRAVLRRAAQHITPTILELSGCDPVFIQGSADVEKAAQAVAFGARLNGGETCIAPRRVYVHAAVAREFHTFLRSLIAERESERRPLEVITVANDEDAVTLASISPYALGATIFGKEPDAARLAGKIRAGVIVINDMIVPTADPRVPFGGRGLSGFGTTRGEQGLLEMTAPKAVIFQRAKRLRHLEGQPDNAEELFTAYLAAAHRRGWPKRLAAWRNLTQAFSRTQKKSR